MTHEPQPHEAPAAAAPDPFFFGYGSLVNRRTHDFAGALPASITGWRRAWRRSPHRALCYLTAVPAEGAEIDGLIAAVPGADWAALDLREAAYRRRPVSPFVRHGAGRALDIAIYAIAEEEHLDPTDENPVLLSYLDVVVQGFLAEFGAPGVARFFETTDGWHAPVMDDRAAPVYPRHQVLEPEERALVDGWLEEVGARRILARG